MRISLAERALPRIRSLELSARGGDRTSEQEYKLFLYLREVAREKSRPAMPPVCLYDLLHSRSQDAYEYALRRLMEGVNRQEECFDEVRELICRAPRTPVRMHEQITNVMAAQWLRGSDWAVGRARAFREEVKERVNNGIAAYSDERLRVGAGLWHGTQFYAAFEEEFGAVFVWSMYLAFGPATYGTGSTIRWPLSRAVRCR